MKKLALATFCALVVLTVHPLVEARGGGGGRGGSGGGGRGGGGGGGGRGASHGRPVSRSPSMSRSNHARPDRWRDTTKPRESIRPTRPEEPFRPVERDRQTAPRRPVEPSRPVGPSRPAGPGDRRPQGSDHNVRDYLQDGRGSRPVQNRPKPNRDSWARDVNLGRDARDRINRNYPDRGRWFDNNFWNDRHYHPYYYHDHIDWWRPATAVGIGAWLGWAATPSYVYYSDDGYYTDPYWYSESGTAYVYPIKPAAAPVQDTGEWMPLGVFAVTGSDDSQVTPKFIFQLVLNKNGTVAGTFFNAKTNETFEVEGVVDSTTQRIAWKIKDKPDSPVLETGLYNLSQPETPVRISFPDGRQKDKLLVRLDGTGQ